MSESAHAETKLVCIATYWDTLKANMARNPLESQEIPCFLEGDNVVTIDWSLANAVGGVKLLVREEDRERAEATLREIPAALGERTPEDGEPEAPDATGQDGRQDTLSADGVQLSEDDEEPLSTRDSLAARACRGAMLGLLFFPIQVYVFTLLIRVFLSNERLGARHRQLVLWAAVINIPYVLILALLIRLVISEL